MRAGSLVIFGIAAYVVFLVATLPARWVEPRVAQAVPGRYQAQSVNGTIWNGDARAVVNLPGATLVVDRARWAFKPWRLLQGRLAYDIALEGAGFSARSEVARSPGGWSLGDVVVQADAALAAAAMPLVSRWRPEGTVRATASALDINGARVRGALRVDLTGVATSLAEVRPLGSYRLDLTADGPGADVALATTQGALRLSGKGRFDWPSRLTLSGQARGEGPDAARLAPMLDLIGPPRADGARAIEWRTR